MGKNGTPQGNKSDPQEQHVLQQEDAFAGEHGLHFVVAAQGIPGSPEQEDRTEKGRGNKHENNDRSALLAKAWTELLRRCG